MWIRGISLILSTITLLRRDEQLINYLNATNLRLGLIINFITLNSYGSAI